MMHCSINFDGSICKTNTIVAFIIFAFSFRFNVNRDPVNSGFQLMSIYAWLEIITNPLRSQ